MRDSEVVGSGQCNKHLEHIITNICLVNPPVTRIFVNQYKLIAGVVIVARLALRSL